MLFATTFFVGVSIGAPKPTVSFGTDRVAGAFVAGSAKPQPTQSQSRGTGVVVQPQSLAANVDVTQGVGAIADVTLGLTALTDVTQGIAAHTAVNEGIAAHTAVTEGVANHVAVTEGAVRGVLIRPSSVGALAGVTEAVARSRSAR